MDFNYNLIQWYSVHKRALPWRETRDPYKIWLSEIILQQTQIKQGLPYYLKFTTNYPTVFDLAKASEDDVLKNWQGLGYYSRARNLHYTAKYVAEKLKGVFPKTYKELLTLKGVGDYTASAIASICYEESAAVVDGNVYRVLSRCFGIDTPINSTEGVKQFKRLAMSLLPKKNIGDYNQAIMEFGAKQCKPKSPNCSNCPVDYKCIALATASIHKLPVKLKKNKIRKRYLNFLVLLTKNHKTVLEKRTEKGIWQHLYQFPMLESDTSITKEELLDNSDFKKIYAHKSQNIELFNTKDILHKLTHQELNVKFWIIRTKNEIDNVISWTETQSLAVPVVIAQFIKVFNP
jgi:A/G-specific adenine glycosylase